MSAVDNVKKICASMGVSIASLEKNLGYGNGYFYSLKRGAIPSDRIVEIANELDVPVYALLDDKTGDLESLRDSPATRAMLHSLRDMSEDEIMAYANFIKMLRSEGQPPKKRTIWRGEE